MIQIFNLEQSAQWDYVVKGFDRYDVYYPMPDYKMPLEVYSDACLPKKGSITEAAPAYDRDRYMFFDEAAATDSLCEDGKFDFFSNSFLTFCKG